MNVACLPQATSESMDQNGGPRDPVVHSLEAKLRPEFNFASAHRISWECKFVRRLHRLVLEKQDDEFHTLQIYTLTKNCNHKRIGLYYLLSAFLFGLSGTIFSVLIRLELYSSGNRIIPPENQNFYNISITLHGLLMIFFLVMPGLFGGFGNYIMPIFLGAPEVIYPRVNNISILILLLSYALIILSITGEFSNGTGWTLYPSLSTSLMSLSPIGIDIILYGLLLTGISSCLTSINFSCTIINMRCYSMTLSIMPVYTWSIYITGFLLLLTLPILTLILYYNKH